MSTTNIGKQPTTTAPLSEGAARPSQQVEPEFVDFEGLRQGFGIKRSLAYQLLSEGLIRGVSLRRRGALRGKRLFSVDSVRAYLNSQMGSVTMGANNDAAA
jgi:hypothetical protein